MDGIVAVKRSLLALVHLVGKNGPDGHIAPKDWSRAHEGAGQLSRTFVHLRRDVSKVHKQASSQPLEGINEHLKFL